MATVRIIYLIPCLTHAMGMRLRRKENMPAVDTWASKIEERGCKGRTLEGRGKRIVGRGKDKGKRTGTKGESPSEMHHLLSMV